MKIPPRLAYVLERDQALDALVKTAISNFEPWLENSNLPFFPEYTKHDIEHVECVLSSAVALIGDDAWDVISPSDACVLILSALLHDCALHLSEDGFLNLVEDQHRQGVDGMTDRPWPLLWKDFLGEASRFDGRKLVGIFGDNQPIKRPPHNPKDFTLRDRLLIGEFLRRHHARLAQEIALFGVPSNTATKLSLGTYSPDQSYLVQISALVARSHGADLRTFMPYLAERFDLRQYKGIHAVFLMTLLRVGDYIQVQADRAPRQMLLVRRLASPISEGEWKAHHAIRDVRNTHEDPEALFIDTLPSDVATYLKVRGWLKGIQNELDVSWAVLGETYGRYENLLKLGLLLRRIRSSIDNVDQFASRVAYVPIRASFRAADSDLLKLLVEPLYGNRPEVGVRELLQNSVDAVRELTQYKSDAGASEIEQTQQEADVVITIEKDGKGETWFVISDRGIGMTSGILRDYFLTAGASFRRSDDWKKAFLTETGESKVLRAGRFGVGALASFLLGSEILVETRHVTEAEGLGFSATIESDAIELMRIKRPVGTKIRIRITTGLAERLSSSSDRSQYRSDEIDWDWFCLRTPSVKRVGLSKELPGHYNIPNQDESTPPSWRKIASPGYSSIFWSFYEGPKLSCNGIKVEVQNHLIGSAWGKRFGVSFPNVAVFDPNGNLPLNLQRTGLTTPSLSFETELCADVIRDFLAFALSNAPTAPGSHGIDDRLRKFKYAGSGRSEYSSWHEGAGAADWYSTQEGVGYLDAGVLMAKKTGSVLVVRTTVQENRSLPLKPGNEPIIWMPTNSNVTSFDWILRGVSELGYYQTHAVEEDPNWSKGSVDVLTRLKRKGSRLLVSALAISRGKFPKRVLKALVVESSSPEWTLFKIGECPNEDPNTWMSLTKSLGQYSIISRIYLDDTYKVECSPVAKEWLRLLGPSEIPYEKARRSAVFPEAVKELGLYISAHEEFSKIRASK